MVLWYPAYDEEIEAQSSLVIISQLLCNGWGPQSLCSTLYSPCQPYAPWSWRPGLAVDGFPFAFLSCWKMFLIEDTLLLPIYLDWMHCSSSQLAFNHVEPTTPIPKPPLPPISLKQLWSFPPHSKSGPSDTSPTPLIFHLHLFVLHLPPNVWLLPKSYLIARLPWREQEE